MPKLTVIPCHVNIQPSASLYTHSISKTVVGELIRTYPVCVSKDSCQLTSVGDNPAMRDHVWNFYCLIHVYLVLKTWVCQPKKFEQKMALLLQMSSSTTNIAIKVGFKYSYM